MGWLSGWAYRKLHEIEGSNAGTQTNYQIRIIVHKGSGTDGGEHVYCNNHCRDDFGDIRFTDSDGETLLDYWMEEYTSGDKATFWVEVPSIPASPDKATVYICYGKSDATTTSNGDNTFLFFDDFEGTSLDTSKWQYDTGSFSVLNSVAKCKSKQKEIRSIENTFGDVEVRAKWRFSSGARGHICFRKEYDNSICRVRDKGYDINFRNPNSDENLRKWPGNSASCITLGTSSYTYSADTWYIGFIRGYGSSLEAKPTEDATLLSATDTTFSSGEIGIGTDDFVTIGTDYVEFDWIFVRKYVSPEPSHGSWGSEEQSGATEVAITDSAAGTEALSRLCRGLNLTDIATGQESFSRPYRQLQIPEQASGLELLLKARNLNLGDIAASLEIIERARQIGAITDTAQSLEQILKQRFISLLDAAAGGETIARPTRMIILADEALSQEILSKLRELTAVTDSAIGIEYVNVGAEGAIKTKIFLLIGDLAIQITGD